MSTHNKCFRAKIRKTKRYTRVYPVSCIKEWFKGVLYIARACYPDACWAMILLQILNGKALLSLSRFIPVWRTGIKRVEP